jgi:polyisoprenyl-teichoic acid--peptidoglycan teichoic acid transferase
MSRRPHPRWRPRHAQRFLHRGARTHTARLTVLLAVSALLVGYLGLASLTRAWPAIFPGEQLRLGIVNDVAKELPKPVGISQPSPDSVFNEPITMLIIGLDKRPLQLDPATVQTDTLMLASVDPVTHTINVLSIPRDLLIEIQTPEGRAYRDRINASFAVGAQDGRYESGARQLVRDFERNFGVDVDHWVVMDFPAVAAFIDRIGGVEVDVPPDLAVPDWYYSDDDVVGRWVSFPPGLQKMDGYHAVAFGRARMFDDDFHRVRRQQLVMEAAMEKVLARGLLNNATALYGDFRNMVTTDVPGSRIPGYALLVRKSGQGLRSYSLADPVSGRETVFDFWTPDGAAVLGWDPQNVSYWFDVVTSHQPVDARTESVPP